MPTITRSIMHQYFLEQIEMPDPSERIAALEALSARNDAPELLLEVAVRLLADPAPGVREQAARVLVGAASPAAAAAVAPLIAHTDIGVRNLAGEVLAQMGAPAVEALQPFLRDTDKDVRKFAIDVLALLPAHPVTPYIAQCLSDDDLNVVLAAVDALGSLKATAYAEDLRVLYQRVPVARPSVVAALGNMGGYRNLSFLENALDDEDPVVQLAAAEALVGFDTLRVLEALVKKAATVGEMARPIVLTSILRLQERYRHRVPTLPADLRPGFEAMLDDTDPEYRRAAVKGLHFYLDDDAISLLLSHAGQDDALDLEIFQSLADYPNAFTCILQALHDGRISTATAINFTLALLAQYRIPEEEIADAGRFLRAHYRMLDTDTRLAVLNVAQMLAHPALYDLIREGQDDLDPALCAFAGEAALQLGLGAVPSPDVYYPER